MVASATAPTPCSRTVLASAFQSSGGRTLCAAVQQSTRRSIRSGACTPSQTPTIPPSEIPQNEARSISRRSSSSTTSPPRSAIEYGPSGTGERPWPRES